MSVQLPEVADVLAERPPRGEDGPLLLAGDVGGTKTMLALVRRDGSVAAEATYPSRDHAGLEDIVRAFRRRYSAPVEQVCLSVAGPVIDGRARITNLPWTLDAEELARSLGASAVHLLNDLQATAYALAILRPDQLRTLHAAPGEAGGTRAVVAVGTGLGEASLVAGPRGELALASEGGHTDFAPRGALQRGLLAWLQKEYEHVSYERVCSGHGIPNLYRYLRAKSGLAEPAWLAAAFAAADDPTPVIAEAGLRREGGDTVCRRTLTLFAAILGAQAGNLALRALATGGVYVGGGIPPRLRAVLRGRAFLEGYLRKGVMSQLVAGIPVHLILEPRAALLGAARYAAACA